MAQFPKKLARHLQKVAHLWRILGSKLALFQNFHLETLMRIGKKGTDRRGRRRLFFLLLHRRSKVRLRPLLQPPSHGRRSRQGSILIARLLVLSSLLLPPPAPLSAGALRRAAPDVWQREHWRGVLRKTELRRPNLPEEKRASGSAERCSDVGLFVRAHGVIP